jgi:outer membrane lipoprotein-sorting protein
MKNLGRFSLITLGIISLVGVMVCAQAELTGDEILDQMGKKGSLFEEKGDVIFVTRFDLVYTDGTEGSNQFKIFSKQGAEGIKDPDRMLIYYMEPEDIEGTIFLSIVPPEEDSRMWLYLPALGMVKELVSESDKEQSFAGTSLSYEQIGGGFDFSDDYGATRLTDETITVLIEGVEEDRPVYVLELTATPEADVDFPTGKMWVDQEELLPLRTEFANEAGELEQVMEIPALGYFEEELIPEQIRAQNPLDGSATTISVLERCREELPDAIFIAENLSSFDPEAYGL